MVKVLPEVTKELRSILDGVGSQPEYLDKGHGLGGEYDMFGRVVWPMAHYGLLGLVESICEREVMTIGQPDDVHDCRQAWLDWLGERRHDARQVATVELRSSVEAVERSALSVPDAHDFHHVCGLLDVWRLYAHGAEQVWPDAGVEPRVQAGLDSARMSWIRVFLKELADSPSVSDGGALYPVQVDQMREAEARWLPESFWWRHLPVLIKEAAGQA